MDDLLQSTFDNYTQFVNPGLAQLMKFAGYGVEVRAEGMYVYDDSGNKFMDFLGGYGVFALGHCHPKVIKAVKDQLDLMPLSSKVLFSSLVGEFCKMIASVMPGDLQYSFLCNSGTEAVEAAIKIGRKYTGRHKFIATVGGFHGKSMGALSATGREQYKTAFEPLVPGFAHAPFNDLDAVAKLLDEETAGVIVEVVQGEGGINLSSLEYLPALKEMCEKNGSLLIVDEVQTGFGRTGTMFAVEHSGVVPDIMTIAKALGGGVVPSGATVSSERVWKGVFGDNPLIHTSTFGGNPLACVAGMATIQAILEEGLVENSKNRGEQLKAGLNAVKDKYPDVLREVRGIGLMVGIQFEMEDVAKLVMSGLNHRGVIAAYTLNNPSVVRMEPPLIVNAEQIDQLLVAFEESVEEAYSGLKSLGLL